MDHQEAKERVVRQALAEAEDEIANARRRNAATTLAWFGMATGAEEEATVSKDAAFTFWQLSAEADSSLAQALSVLRSLR